MSFMMADEVIITQAGWIHIFESVVDFGSNIRFKLLGYGAV
jgi:hypothetical protein